MNCRSRSLNGWAGSRRNIEMPTNTREMSSISTQQTTCACSCRAKKARKRADGISLADNITAQLDIPLVELWNGSSRQ